jgi:hypothetical protein
MQHNAILFSFTFYTKLSNSFNKIKQLIAERASVLLQRNLEDSSLHFKRQIGGECINTSGVIADTGIKDLEQIICEIIT